MKIDMYFDTICPWCWIGKHNMETAIKNWKGEDFELTYRTFFLDETIPIEGVPASGRLQKKYNMSDSQTSAYLAQLFQLGDEAGVDFDYDKVELWPNTIASHVLINMFEDAKKSNVLEKIFHGFFNQGKDIGDIEVLQNIGEEFGVSPNDFQKELANSEKTQKVLGEVFAARNRGVQSVPFYIINDKYKISGAQKPKVITQGLNKIVMLEKGTN